MGLIKSAAEIMSGRRMPPGWVPPPRAKSRGRPPLNRTCELPDCTAKHAGNGLCQKHLDTKAKWGDPYHVFKRGRFGRCICPQHTPRSSPWG